MYEEFESIIERLEDGDFVMVYDADEREDEVDLVTPSEKITPQKIRTLRRDAGGLICVTVPPETWKKLKMPYLSDLLEECADEHSLLLEMKADDIPYDERSTFSLTVNHRDTFTGITDIDRSLTIQRFAKLGSEIDEHSTEEAQKMFGDEFRSPGHVFLLNATEGLVSEREGHTELTTALLKLTELYPSMTICEMLSDQGDSLDEEQAKEYGKENDIPIIEGKKIKEELKDKDV
ncbi:MAG: 3,4-dihydroxy-2-butanone-4-phosphate synthase [Candidatus Thermoplasmatota archaeon]|nr:3,4-dihydroxy-2-butanone-4-phosphate synthase [Candidatus Thermoplasmatota archaeon]MBS3790789.1 3,4-dihydroxy-2-butanone-4-phosphate synthase [Candidatus Thermoplasmatota archaeon]